MIGDRGGGCGKHCDDGQWQRLWVRQAAARVRGLVVAVVEHAAHAVEGGPTVVAGHEFIEVVGPPNLSCNGRLGGGQAVLLRTMDKREE